MPDPTVAPAGLIAYLEEKAKLHTDDEFADLHAQWIADLQTLCDDYREAMEAIETLLVIPQDSQEALGGFSDGDYGRKLKQAIAAGEAVLKKQKPAEGKTDG
jgi:hypothetical protein